MVNRKAFWGWALVGIFLLLGQMAWAEESEFRWDGNLSPGDTLSIKGVNGGVEAARAEGSQARVVAYKKGRRSDPDSVEIRVVEHAEGVTICAVYPTASGDDPNQCLPFARGRSSVRDNDVVVRFVVEVPSQTHFIGKTVNGKVEAIDLDGDVEATTVNGSIHISTTGLAEASTVNGSIRAEMGAADWEGDLEFKTVNGSITLGFPESLSTGFKLESLNGGISSDFEMTLTSRSGKRWGKKKMEGRIGQAKNGRELTLQTVNGDVELRRSRQ